MSILKSYSKVFPLPENAVSIFEGEWVSSIPGISGGGTIPLFSDSRLIDIIQQCGGLSGKRCLELGPLEGAHTHIMWKSGAKSIISIEANQRAFMKCLITKELLGYEAKFLLGNFAKYVESTSEKFDFTNMSGVLYHMTAPHELIANVARISDQVACWTHYFDRSILASNPQLRVKFEFEPKEVEIGGVTCRLFKQKYLADIEVKGYAGGREEISYWMEKKDILSLFEGFGMDTRVLSEDRDHPHGPCMNFYAIRRGL